LILIENEALEMNR